MKITYFTICFLLLLLFSSCNEKELERINFLEITTHPVEEVTLISANLNGELKGIQVGVVDQHGFVWSKTNEDPDFVLNDGKVLLGAKEADGVFTTEIAMLEKNQSYFVRSFAIAEGEEIYGKTISFTTHDIALTTDSISYIQSRTAVIHGSFAGINSTVELNGLGVVWSRTNPNPVIDGDTPDSFVVLEVDLGDGPFSGTIPDLQDSSFYYYRTFAILNFGNEIRYGETKTWETELNDVWHQKRNMIEPTKVGRGFAIDGYGYCIYENKVYRYDPVNDTWDFRQQHSEPALFKGGYFAIGPNIYITCGTHNDAFPVTKKMYKYDTLNDQWSIMPDFPGEARKWVIAFAIGNVGYLGLGERADESEITDFWKFEEGIGWTELEITNPDFPGTNHYVLIGGYTDGERGYIVGDQISANFWIYHPATNTWEEKEDLPGGRSQGHGSFHINNELYLCTGTTEGQAATKVLYRYSYEKDEWAKLASLPGLARHNAMAFAIGNKGYIGGGHYSWPNTTDEFWEYKAPLD